MPCWPLKEEVDLLYIDMDGYVEECVAIYKRDSEWGEPYFSRDYDGSYMVDCLAWRPRDKYKVANVVERPNDGWYNPEHNLPEKYKTVLLYTKSKNGNTAVSTGYWNGLRWIKKIRSEVKYWHELEMPLDMEDVGVKAKEV